MGSLYINDPSLPDGELIEVPGKGVFKNRERYEDVELWEEDIVIDYQAIIDDANSRAQAETSDSDALPVGTGSPGPAADHGTVLTEDKGTILEENDGA
jgi:hypothetical protein